MDRHYQFSDLASSVADLERILATLGIEIVDPSRSPFKHAEQALREMDQVARGVATSDATADHRERWSRGFSLGDLALKLVAAHATRPAEFKKLVPHLRYLAADAELNLCSFVPGGHAGTPAEQKNDFIAELRLAACCILMMDDLEFDPPRGSKKVTGQNPDIIGRFNGRRWAVECKTLHPNAPGAVQDPQAFLSLVEKARDQIKAAIADGRADTGLVVMNMKNTIDPASVLPVQQRDGEHYYGAHLNLPFAAVSLMQRYNAFISPITTSLSDRETKLASILTDPAVGGHPSIAPSVLAVYFVIDGILKDGQPTLTMLRSLQVDPEPEATGETLKFAQRINACLQDQPSHPGVAPVGSREDFIRWASASGPFTLHEREVVLPENASPELMGKVRELEASGKESLEWEEDEMGRKVRRVIRKRPRGEETET